jgi:L-seryl-tRNA(Ser) seleniumtransferase
MKRRDLIKYLSVAPLAGGLTGAPSNSASAGVKSLVKRDLIKELGLRTFISIWSLNGPYCIINAR